MFKWSIMALPNQERFALAVMVLATNTACAWLLPLIIDGDRTWPVRQSPAPVHGTGFEVT